MGSSSNKYFNFCPNSNIYSLGKQRNENLDKALSEQKNLNTNRKKKKNGTEKRRTEKHLKMFSRSQNPNQILIPHLDINSLRNKFEILKETITSKVDILLISETKLDSSFPLNQFHIDGVMLYKERTYLLSL